MLKKIRYTDRILLGVDLIEETPRQVNRYRVAKARSWYRESERSLLIQLCGCERGGVLAKSTSRIDRPRFRPSGNLLDMLVMIRKEIARG